MSSNSEESDSTPPDYVTEVMKAADALTFHVALPGRPPRDRLNPVLVTVVRDERGQLPGFLRHYRRRGIREFIVIDNGSRDGSLDYLRDQPDVFAARVDLPFNWQAKQSWITRVIDTIGYHRWYLVVDADERVVFDGDSRFSFSDLTARMEIEGKWRIRGMLVDLYGPGPLLAPENEGHPEDHDLFDAGDYRRELTGHLASVKGGPRPRALSGRGFDLDPELTKYPLFRLAPGEVMANPHHAWPYEENFKSPCYLGILHYKFGAGIRDRITQAISEGNYWNDSLEYRAYQSALEEDPNLSLAYEGSRRYTSPDDLVDCGLIEGIDWRAHRWRRLWLRLRGRLS